LEIRFDWFGVIDIELGSFEIFVILGILGGGMCWREENMEEEEEDEEEEDISDMVPDFIIVVEFVEESSFPR
jgi:hypothetical protein